MLSIDKIRALFFVLRGIIDEKRENKGIILSDGEEDYRDQIELEEDCY